MILHTVLPEEFVLAGLGQGAGEGPWWPAGPWADAGRGAGPVSPAKSFERTTLGLSGPVRLIVESDPAGTWRIGRLLSSDPYDYLNPEFSPGRPTAGPPT